MIPSIKGTARELSSPEATNRVTLGEVVTSHPRELRPLEIRPPTNQGKLTKLT